MRLTKEQIADIRRDAPLGPDANLDLSEVGALCDMADELLDGDAYGQFPTVAERQRDEWKRRAESSEALMDNNIRDLRSICETLAKRIAALEGKPRTFDGTERRRHWVADRRQCEPKGGWGFFLSGDRWVIDSRRHDGKDRRNAK